MSDYPRTRNGWVDSGEPLRSNVGRKCPNCRSSNFKETISLESCSSCGYQVDYWGGGGNAVADAYESRRNREYEKELDRKRRKEEEEYRSWHDDNWQDNDY